MEIARPWWRGLEVEVRAALEAWGGRALAELEAALRRRLPGALIARETGGADVAVAWDGVEGRSEVRVLVERELAHGHDLTRAGARALSQRGPGRTVMIALAGSVDTELAHALAVTLSPEDPVLDGGTIVVDLARLRRQRVRRLAAAAVVLVALLAASGCIKGAEPARPPAPRADTSIHPSRHIE